MNQSPNYGMAAAGYGPSTAGYAPAAPSRSLELTVRSAKNLKNVNWRSGELRPVVVAWIDPEYRIPTKIAESGNPKKPRWDEKLTLPVKRSLEEAIITVEIYHEKASNVSKSLVGTANLRLKEVADSGGLDDKQLFKLKLRRPSGRPQGVIKVGVRIRESNAWPQQQAPAPAQQSPYGYGQGYYQSTPGYSYPPYSTTSYPQASYGSPYQQTPAAFPATAYSASNAYTAAQSSSYYSQPAGGASPVNRAAEQQQKKGNKLGGMGGLAVGALAGAMGALAVGGIAHEVKDHYEEKGRDEELEREEDEAEAAGDWDDDGY